VGVLFYNVCIPMTESEHNIDEREVRLERLTYLKKQGVDAFPAHTERSHALSQILDVADDLIKKEQPVTIVGRVMALRPHGGSTFAHLEDGTGAFQIYLKKDMLGDEIYEQFEKSVDVGDFLQVTGTVFTTKRGEPTIQVSEWRLLTKTIRPLPEKWHGLQDIEMRFRKRYLDMISNKDVVDVFKKRAAIVKSIREFLDDRGFLEVETPILQPLPGGANARPFVTHHNTLDADLYLRIAPELYLKRIIIGGVERVYEFARCFRNEGMDWSHNPEFTQVEFYASYMDYIELMDFTEDLILSVVKKANGDASIEYQDNTIVFEKPFRRIQFRQALIDAAGIDIEAYPDQKSIYNKAKELGLKDVAPHDGRGRICDELYKEYVRKNIVQPTFVIDHPIELSPLSKKKTDDPRYVERFQLVLGGGIELVNAFSELNDPIDQRERFNAQQEMALAGDEEAHPIDEDFIEALEHGMPPTAGFGMGIDRLTNLLTNRRNIKEAILFPTLRPKS